MKSVEVTPLIRRKLVLALEAKGIETRVYGSVVEVVNPDDAVVLIELFNQLTEE